MQSTYTITFGDQAENHVGMKKIGKLATEGFSLHDLQTAGEWFLDNNVDVKIYDLSMPVEDTHQVDKAYLLVAKNGLSAVCNPDSFFHEQSTLNKDSKAFMYGRVVNKKARHNLCFDDQASDPDYANGLGTVVAFDTVPLLNNFRKTLPSIIGQKASNLKAEGNYYYDVTKCGIGFHGDSERKLVVGIRVGSPLPLRYQWYHESKPFGPSMEFILDHGDVYIMSEKAVGTDWKRKKIFTLRHAAGCPRFLQV